MRKLILFALFLAISHWIIAQESDEYIRFNVGCNIDYQLGGYGEFYRELGFLRIEENKAKGFNIAFGFSSIDRPTPITYQTNPTIHTTVLNRYFFNIEAHQGYNLLKTKGSNLIVGAFAGIGLNYQYGAVNDVLVDELVFSGYFKERNFFHHIGIGTRVDYFFGKKESRAKHLGVKWGILDLGYVNYEILDRSLPLNEQVKSSSEIDFDRGYFHVFFGWMFKL